MQREREKESSQMGHKIWGFKAIIALFEIVSRGERENMFEEYYITPRPANLQTISSTGQKSSWSPAKTTTAVQTVTVQTELTITSKWLNY